VNIIKFSSDHFTYFLSKVFNLLFTHAPNYGSSLFISCHYTQNRQPHNSLFPPHYAECGVCASATTLHNFIRGIRYY